MRVSALFRFTFVSVLLLLELLNTTEWLEFVQRGKEGIFLSIATVTLLPLYSIYDVIVHGSEVCS